MLAAGAFCVTTASGESQLPPTERHESLIREMHAQLGELDTASLRKAQRFNTLLDKLGETGNQIPVSVLGEIELKVKVIGQTQNPAYRELPIYFYL